jgi:hypothetical protein
MSGTRFKQMPKLNMSIQDVPPADRVVTEEDMLDSNSQLNWFFL